MSIKGTLIPIGGNEDKGIEVKEQYHLEYIGAGILSNIVKESGGPGSLIIIIPTASSIPSEVGENYIQAFKKLGCTNIHVMDIRRREQAEDPLNIELIKKANCVMFSGGNQSKITSKIAGSAIHKIMLERYKNEDFVIAGTSAGAMCMSQEMISGGSSKESFVKGAVNMNEGMNFISDLIIDSHFIRRGRFGRIVEAVSRFPHLIGLGLAEDTGVIIKNGTSCTVIGSGMVIFFDGTKLHHNTSNQLEQGTPMTISNLLVHVLTNSDHYDLNTRKVTVLPIDAPFI